MHTTLRNHGYRFLVSPDGVKSAWVHPADTTTYVDWTDCTDMSDTEFHNFIANLQAMRPHIVGVAVGS